MAGKKKKKMFNGGRVTGMAPRAAPGAAPGTMARPTMTRTGMPMMKKGGKVMTAGAGSGQGRKQKSNKAKNGMKKYPCGGKVTSKRGYGAARKG